MGGRAQFYLSSWMIAFDGNGYLLGLEGDHWETPGGSLIVGFFAGSHWQVAYFLCALESAPNLSAVSFH